MVSKVMGEAPEGAVGLVGAFLAPTALLSLDDGVSYSRILRIPETLTCCDLDKVDGRRKKGLPRTVGNLGCVSRTSTLSTGSPEGHRGCFLGVFLTAANPLCS